MNDDDDRQRDRAASGFLRTVTAAMQPITATGVLNFETSRYDEQLFGNAFVTFRSKNVRVRFVRDRGSVVVELICLKRPESWHPIERVLAAVGVVGPPEDGAVDVAAAADLLIRHLDQIEARMCSEDGAKRLSELEAAAARQLLEQLNRSKPRED